LIGRRWFLAAPALAPRAQTSFTAQLWDSIRAIYLKTLAHPFLAGLADGSLPADRFRYYLVQDGLYLRGFSQALSVLSSKAPRAEWAVTLARHSSDAIQAERELHAKILGSYGITPQQAARAPMAPTNRAYVNHLLASVHRLGFAEGLAALLPCYWVYLEVGRALKKRGSRVAAYQQWIDNYGGEDYARTVQQVLQMTDSAPASPAERASARELFVLSARYEYLFWDMAWRMERWLP
jgi:thiaminase/transcriptional activator TenA